MDLFLQQVVEGLTAGAIYGSLALSLVIIYRATGVVNFGQGEMATLMAFVAWQLTELGISSYVAIVLTLVISFVFGALVFRLTIYPLSKAPVDTLVVVTIGLFLCCQAICLWVWGADQRPFISLIPNGAIQIASVRLTYYTLAVAATMLAIGFLLSIYFQHSNHGLAMRASASEGINSLLVGINVDRMLMLGWGIASVIGFVAALLVAPKLFLSPTMMVSLLIYALAAATLGGWQSPVGAVVGGLIVGVTETLGATYLTFLGAELRLAIPVVLTLLVLLVRPDGLFGTSRVVRA